MLRTMFVRLLVIGLLVILSACGGGGGGGGGGTVAGGGSGGSSGGEATGSTLPLVAHQAQLDRGNGKDFASLFVELSSLSDEVRNSVPALFSGPDSILLHPSNRRQNGSTIVDISISCASGSIEYDGSFSDATGIGTLTISHNACHQSETTVSSGAVKIVVHDTNASRTPITYDWEFLDYRLAQIGTDAALIYRGDVKVVPVGFEAESTTDFSLQVMPGQDYIQAHSLVSRYPLSRTGVSVPERALRSGRIAFSDLGYVDMSSTINPQGRHFLDGAGQSRLRIDLTSDATLRLALDENGDAVFERFMNGAPELYMTAENMPVIPQLYVESDHSAMLHASYFIEIGKSFDRNFDFLAFNVTTVGLPDGGRYSLSLTETSAVFTPSVGGDYTLRITADDGNGGLATQDLVVSVPMPSPDMSRLDGASFAVSAGGSGLTIDAAPSNVDAMPVSYELVEAPPGLTIDSGGRIEWNPVGVNRFFHAEEYDVFFRVRNAQHVEDVKLRVRVYEDSGSAPVVRSGLVFAEAEDIIYVGDFSAHTGPELLVTDVYKSIYTLKYVSGEYRQDWIYPYSLCPGSILSVVPLQTSTSTGRELAVRCKGGEIVVIAVGGDRPLRSVAKEVGFDSYTSGFGAGDLDGDGREELVMAVDGDSTSAYIVVLDALSLDERWRIQIPSRVNQLKVGNVDNDSALEIVTDRGAVVDGVSRFVQWQMSNEIFNSIALGDVDGDGVEEIVTRKYEGILTVYDAVSRGVKTQKNSSVGFCGLAIGELDGDAGKEIVASSCSAPGGVDVLSAGASGLVLDWFVSDSRGSNVVVGDVDGDADVDITYLKSQAAKRLATIDVNSQSETYLENGAHHFDIGFFGGLPVSSGAGESLALFATRNSLFSGAGTRMLKLTPSGEYELSSALPGRFTQAINVCTEDIDADGELDVISATWESSTAQLVALDLDTFSTKYAEDFSNISSVVLNAICADLNGDGVSEAVLQHADGVVVRDFVNASTWQGSSISGALDRMDLDGDGRDEIMALSDRKVVAYSFTGSAFVEVGVFEDSGPTSGFPSQLIAGDIDSDGQVEVLYSTPIGGSGDNELVVLDFLLREQRRIPVPDGVTAIGQSDTGKLLIGTSRWIGGANDYAWRVKQIDFLSGQVDWQSPALNGAVMPNTFNLVPAQGALPERLQFGTTRAMYMTR